MKKGPQRREAAEIKEGLGEFKELLGWKELR